MHMKSTTKLAHASLNLRNLDIMFIYLKKEKEQKVSSSNS